MVYASLDLGPTLVMYDSIKLDDMQLLLSNKMAFTSTGAKAKDFGVALKGV